MKKYRTSPYGKLIETVEVERETEASVWINGQRNAKRTEYHSYFDTFAEAKQHLLDLAEKSVNSAQLRLERAKERYDKVEGLKEL